MEREIEITKIKEKWYFAKCGAGFTNPKSKINHERSCYACLGKPKMNKIIKRIRKRNPFITKRKY